MQEIELKIPNSNELDYRRYLVSDEKTMVITRVMATTKQVVIINLLSKSKNGIKIGIMEVETTMRI